MEGFLYLPCIYPEAPTIALDPGTQRFCILARPQGQPHCRTHSKGKAEPVIIPPGNAMNALPGINTLRLLGVIVRFTLAIRVGRSLGQETDVIVAFFL